MMQVQGANMMDMGTNPAAAFWGASRHASSWSNQAAMAGHHIPTSASSSDPKMAEKLMTELQVSYLNFGTAALDSINRI